MIALLLALQAAGQIRIDGARSLTNSDRVIGQGILFRCDFPLNGKAVAWQTALDGEVTGVGKGPLTPAPSDTRIAAFKSYRGSVSYDEKLPQDRRPLFLSMNSRQTIDGTAYEGELAFTYDQDGNAINRITRAARVRDAKITFFKARDIVSSNGLRFPKKGASPVATTACTASDRNPQ